jgi:hypothetical protein
VAALICQRNAIRIAAAINVPVTTTAIATRTMRLPIGIFQDNETGSGRHAAVPRPLASRAICPRVRSISEPLADNSAQCSVGTLHEPACRLTPRMVVVCNVDLECIATVRFGGGPVEIAERGRKLFARKVLPVLKSPGVQDSPVAAE